MLSKAIIPILFLITGFTSAYLIFGESTPSLTTSETFDSIDSSELQPIDNSYSTEPVINRVALLENQVANLTGTIQELQQSIEELSEQYQAAENSAGNVSITHRKKPFSSALRQRLYSVDSLLRGGIDPSRAEDIVRRKNAFELQRLTLQDRATRENYLNTERYYDELEAINALDMSLREELGDDAYDEYLYNSKQNNRIRIASIMLGSEAEQAGIQKGDVVLSYDNERMFTWQELKDATGEGSLGEYVSISIYRNGEIYSYSVPRGPLGMQLGATRLEP